MICARPLPGNFPAGALNFAHVTHVFVGTDGEEPGWRFFTNIKFSNMGGIWWDITLSSTKRHVFDFSSNGDVNYVNCNTGDRI